MHGRRLGSVGLATWSASFELGSVRSLQQCLAEVAIDSGSACSRILEVRSSRRVTEEEARPYSTIASGILVEAFPWKSVAYVVSLFVVETSARSLRNGLSGKTPSKSA